MAGSLNITASAPGWGEATFPTTVLAGALTKISVSLSSATLAEGGFSSLYRRRVRPVR